MTLTDINAHYRKNMCEQLASICQKQLGRLPTPTSEEKVGLFGHKKQEQERKTLCNALRGYFDVTLNGGEQLGYDALCDAVWKELAGRVPYWRVIVRLCNECELLDRDETQLFPWERFLDALDLMDLAMFLEDRYDVELRNEIADEVSLGSISVNKLLNFLIPVIDELELLDD